MHTGSQVPYIGLFAGGVAAVPSGRGEKVARQRHRLCHVSQGKDLAFRFYGGGIFFYGWSISILLSFRGFHPLCHDVGENVGQTVHHTVICGGGGVFFCHSYNAGSLQLYQPINWSSVWQYVLEPFLWRWMAVSREFWTMPRSSVAWRVRMTRCCATGWRRCDYKKY